MKRLLTLALILVITLSFSWANAVTGVAAPVAPTIIAATSAGGPVSHWRFDDGSGTVARDTAGDNNAVVHGARWSTGVFGDALNFDGVNDYVEAVHHPSLDMTGELTIAAWVFLDASGTWIILCKQPSSTWRTNYPGNYELDIMPSGVLRFGHQTGTGDWEHSFYTSDSTVGIGVWHHVAVTFTRGGDVTFYMNGSQAGVEVQTGVFGLVNAEPVRIGTRKDAFSYFRGLMDDVILYSRALSFEEIRQLYAQSFSRTYHVDAAHGSDLNDGRSPDTAFATIQKAIDVADDGEVVSVYPGVYREQLYFQGKAITVQGAGDAAVLETPGRFAVSFYMGEGPDTVLRNFVITNSYAGIIAAGSSPTITNVTVVGNDLGVEAYRGANPHISSSIFWGNSESNLYGCTAAYSCVEREAEGEGNFSADPLFADPENGDYHLLSERGRYWPEHDVWVLDDVTSPCVDAGDPDADFSRERTPNGGRVNIGAYGGTPFASRSPDCQLVCQPGQAYDPSPANGAFLYNTYPILSWMPGAGAATHDVYFGDGNPPPFVRNQVETEFQPGTLTMGSTYWWRIDEVNGNSKTTGPVWDFTVREVKGRACFTGENPVWVDGALVPISQVGPGMSVSLVASAGMGELPMLSRSFGCVERVQAHEGTFVCYDVLFESGNSICVAECHYFLAESGRWVSLQVLRPGTRLQTATGSVRVASVTRRPTPYVGTVYNLVVPNSHRYLVGKDAVIARDY